MSESMQEISGLLAAPFPAQDIKWRIARKNKNETRAQVLAYVDARAIQRRLDDVFGWNRWSASYSVLGEGVMCTLTIYCGDEEIVKSDAADYTNIEHTKGGVSDAFKRVAASGFGIGRYLYGLKETWVEINEYGSFTPPTLPKWALPSARQRSQDAPKTPNDEPPISQWQASTIKRLLKEHGIDSASWHEILKKCAGVKSGNDLNFVKAGEIIELLQSQAQAIGPESEPQPPTYEEIPPESENINPHCPECAGEMWHQWRFIREKPESKRPPLYVCKHAGKWDPKAKKRDGCQGIYWTNEDATANMTKKAGLKKEKASDDRPPKPADIPF